jgi:ATP-dependent exoDNAse (exonuclease V) beta subunit
MAQAPAVHREIDFLLAWPPQRYFVGSIDCLYQDGRGDWHLVDYKTNDVTAEAVAAAAKKYEMQLYVYAMAAERTVGRTPVELVVHFLRLGIEHRFTWNDAARQRAVELVNDAIAASDGNDLTPDT